MRSLCVLMLLVVAGGRPASAQAPPAGFVPIFDGKSLDGWRDEKGLWRVEDGILIGETTAEKPLKRNEFLIWDQGEIDDFELKLKFRISGTDQANSGVQIRSKQRPDGVVSGYQADFNRAGQWVGGLYEEKARGILAKPGEQIGAAPDSPPTAKKDEILAAFKKDDWNDLTVIAQANTITIWVNGLKTIEFVDKDREAAVFQGLLALQVHAGPPMKVEFKDIFLKRLPLRVGFKKVVFIAGTPSHGYFSHEHNAGSLLLSDALDAARREQGLPVLTSVYTNGWPKDPTALDNADAVVFFCDGGRGHLAIPHLDEIDQLVSERGLGVVCLHYGVEVPKGKAGEALLRWIGGYFEAHYSVNPTWMATFTVLPIHPITRGVNPFRLEDEWYYHMRFVPDLEGVMPILSDVPPRESLSRKDGSHSNNPEVREAVLVREEPQHVAWAYERPSGNGRGFGFTGAHFHQNWQHDDFRKVVLNAIAWVSGIDVPSDGVSSQTPTVEDLEMDQDEPRPNQFQFKAPRTSSSPPRQPPVQIAMADSFPVAIASTNSNDRSQARREVVELGASATEQSLKALEAIVVDPQRPLWLRREAIAALGKSPAGAEWLISRWNSADFDSRLKPAAQAALALANDPSIQSQIKDLWAPLQDRLGTALPSLLELAQRRGNAQNGRVLYHTTGGCMKCHQVNGIGLDVGPNLSEIGRQLTRPELLATLLYPGANIPDAYETWLVLLQNGKSETGMIERETLAELTLKEGTGRLRRIPIISIEERAEQPISLMPTDLQRLLTVDELVDLVEYLSTLQTRRG